MTQLGNNRLDPLAPSGQLAVTNAAITGPFIDITHPDYGAIGDGQTDNSAAFARAFNKLNPTLGGSQGVGGGGIVFAPAGIFGTSQQLVVPPQVRLLCAGRNTTVIKALPGFPFANLALGNASQTAVVKLVGFGSRFEHGSIDCQNLNNSIGLWSDTINEQAGAFSFQVFNFRRYGVLVDASTGSQPTAQTYDFLDGELFLSTTAPSGAIGMLINGAGSPAREIARITVNSMDSSTTPAASVGFDFRSTATFFHHLHAEHVTTGVACGTDANGSATGMMGVDLQLGPGITGNGLAIGNGGGGASSYLFMKVKNGGVAGHLIADADRGKNYDAAAGRTFYAVSGGATPAQISLDDAFIVNGINVTLGNRYAVNGVNVVGAQITGWNAPTGTPTRGTFDASATLATTAQTLVALIADLRSHGLIGT